MANPEPEWEYEYSSTEAEDFYLTVDLTTRIPDAAALRTDAVRKQNVADQIRLEQVQSDVVAVDVTGVHDDTTTANTQVVEDVQMDDATDGPSSAIDATSKFQIFGLDTKNPIVRLDSNFYSCEWFTDVGTQVFVAKAGDVEDSGGLARKGKTVDVVGLSQTRLMAKPVTMRRKT